MYIRDIYTPNPTKEDDEYVETPCTAIGGNVCTSANCRRVVVQKKSSSCVEAVPEYIYSVLNNYIKLDMTCLDLVICSTDGVMASLDFGYDSTHHLK